MRRVLGFAGGLYLIGQCYAGQVADPQLPKRVVRLGQDLTVRLQLQTPYGAVRSAEGGEPVSLSLTQRRRLDDKWTEYEFHVWPRAVGTYDLVSQLVDADGATLAGREQPYFISVDSKLGPDDSGVLSAPRNSAYVPRKSGYTAIMGGVIALWAVVCGSFLLRKGKREVILPDNPASPMSVPASLRDVLTRTCEKGGTAEEKQEVERRLLAHWVGGQERDGLETCRRLAAKDVEMRERLELLDGWLYGGRTLSADEIEFLLRGVP